jgi:hypothetical protein
MTIYIQCSLCRLIRHREHLIGRRWYLPANWRSFIRWSPDLWVSQCYSIECDRSFYCALFCVFMTRVSHVQSACALNTRYIYIYIYIHLYWEIVCSNQLRKIFHSSVKMFQLHTTTPLAERTEHSRLSSVSRVCQEMAAPPILGTLHLPLSPLPKHTSTVWSLCTEATSFLS